MKRIVILVFGFLGLFALLPSPAEAQYGFGRRASDVLRQIEQRRIQVQICSENSQSGWAFEECLRGRPLAGVIEGNRALVDDVVDAGHDGHGSGYGASDIVRGTVWGRGDDYRRREKRRAPRTIISPVEGGITSGVIIGTATGSLRNGIVTGAATYGSLRIVDAILERRERSRMERELRQEEAEARMREREEVSLQSSPVSMGEFELTNASSATIEVFDGEKFFFRMRPGETKKVTAPREQYTARALVPNNRGGISRGDLETHSTNNGWTFEEPAVARR